MSDRGLNKSMRTLFPQQGHGQCRVCNEPVVNGNWNYCSERCREIAQAVQRMFVWDFVRQQVLNRDDYTCQQCGLTRDRWWRAYEQTEELIRDRRREAWEREDVDESPDAIRDRYEIDDPDGGFHVDHITRIADGGHKFDESNLRTLCKWCHRAKTAEENASTPSQDVTLDDYL